MQAIERSAKALAMARAEGSSESITAVVAAYEVKGFTGQFGSDRGAMVRCHDCHEASPAAQVPLLALHRFEGVSDPDEEALVVGLECPACGGLGTMVLPYGPNAALEDAAVLAELLDDRDQSRITPGT